MSRYTPTNQRWKEQRLRVLDRDGYQCVYCGKPLVGSDATVDHINAISLNPEHNYTDDDLLAACRTCNGRKGDKTLVRLRYHNPRWFNE